MATVALDVRLLTAGGGKTYIENLVPELVRLGEDHRFVLVRAPRDGLRLPDLDVVWSPVGGPLRQLVWCQAKLPRQLRAAGVDLYHSLKHPGPLAPGIPTVFTLRAAGPFDGSYPLPLPEMLYWNLLGGLFLRRVDHLIAVSTFVVDSLPVDLRPDADRLDLVPHGLPEAFRRVSPAARTRPGTILAVGNIVPVKNYPTLVRAYAALGRDLVSRHALVVAGDCSGAEAVRVRRTAEALGIADRVRLPGFLDPAAMQRAYAEADVFVVASLHESFSFALLEAMACGVACVTTDCGGPVEVGGDAVEVVEDPRDVRALAGAIGGLLGDPEGRRRLGEMARRRALEFSWELAARRTLDVYARVLARRGRE